MALECDVRGHRLDKDFVDIISLLQKLFGELVWGCRRLFRRPPFLHGEEKSGGFAWAHAPHSDMQLLSWESERCLPPKSYGILGGPTLGGCGSTPTFSSLQYINWPLALSLTQLSVPETMQRFPGLSQAGV